MPFAHDIITDISERVEKFARARVREALADEVFAGSGATDPAASLLLETAAAALTGGKRLRARFALLGWRAATAREEPNAAALSLGAALEIFQAAALVHDDIVDNSDTRRGHPSTWRALEAAHRERGWVGDSEAFGRSGAILLGDLLLGWSDDLFEEATAGAAERRATRAVYQRMRRDVILGQFLDVSEEAAWVRTPDAEHAERAMRIAVLKSARYSVAQPLELGATLGGASDAVRRGLAEVGAPLGLAFQLRDDILGVFGDPSVTGKPAGDDLREGKRTLLVAYAREGMDPAERSRFDARIGAADLAPEDVRALQDLVRTTGALERAEALISDRADAARTAIGSEELAGVAGDLERLVEATTRRET
ncbi:polyprenyl synthetase family protein [Microbacterium sp. ZXX196]|uniref:polyprenyl synthetase family protein n=1 Tax=Microbacterium sp. ZXX196 TaxID=2609291 RepID=UPI00132980C6|nr:polyprenyl synthetase family protein [Microbacterium sp. ZXX196]